MWWCGLALVLPLAFCAARLSLDLWSDEVYTLHFYAGSSFAHIVGDYSSPNNHILYSLLLRPVYLLGESNVVLRLPSLLFAAGTLLLVFRCAYLRWGSTAAVAAMLALGLNQMFLVHAMQVRGYGLQMLLTAALANLAWPDARRPARGRLLAIVLLGAALLYVMPTSSLFFAPLALVGVYNAWRERSVPRAMIAELTAWGLAGVLAGLLYWPIADQVRGVLDESEPAGPAQLGRLAVDLLWAANHDFWFVWPLALGGAICWWRRTRDVARDNRWNDALTLAILLVGPLAIAVALRTAPFVRNFCPWLIAASLLIGWWLAELIDAALRRWPNVARHVPGPMLAMLLLAAPLVPQLLSYPSRLDEVRAERFAQDGYYNYYAADFAPSEVANYLARHIQTDRPFLVAYDEADHYNLVYYLAKAGLPVPPQRLPAPAEEEAVPVPVYYVSPALRRYDDLERITGLTEEQLRRFTEVARFGYYRVYRSPRPVSYAAPATPSQR